jgi:DNA-binding Lrp family transcriptional regulator
MDRREGMRQMDSVDEKIISILKKNSRTPYVTIAKRLRTTEGTVRNRVKRLQEDGVIKTFTLKTASKNVKALVEVRIEVNINTSDISKRIKAMPEVEAVYEVSGDVDIIAIIDVMSTQELNDVIEGIRRLGSTISTETRLILNEL